MVKKFASVSEAVLATKKSSTVGSMPLGKLWVRVVASKYDEFVPSLTLKEVGQLKQLDKRSEGQGEAIVRWVVANWIEFVSAVKSQAGWKNVPNKPHVGFLLQHVGIAANMISPKKPAEKYETPKPLSSPKPVQLISQPKEPEEKPLSMAEILAELD